MNYPIVDEYHDWLIDITTGWCSDHGNYKQLMEYLYSIPFSYSIERDANRAADGEDFRLRFADSHPDYTYRDIYLYLTDRCNLLEMLAALACRCEDSIMSDPDAGDRTGIWFFDMIKNMHLEEMKDGQFNPEYTQERIDILLNRDYAPNGDGGLFTVNTSADLRTMEIWYQMNWHLSEIAEL